MRHTLIEKGSVAPVNGMLIFESGAVAALAVVMIVVIRRRQGGTGN